MTGSKTGSIEREVFIGVYVDDLTIVSSDSVALAWLDSKLSARFEMNPTESKDLDADNDHIGWILSTEIRHYRKRGCLEMSQTQAIERLAARYNLTDLDPVSLPLDPAVKLCPLPADQEAELDYHSYLSLLDMMLEWSES